jgi:glutamate carboxypeptidase
MAATASPQGSGRDREARRAEAAALAERALEETVELVAISTPSGEAVAAERAVAAVLPMLPTEAEVERIPCSSPAHAPDLLARLRGEGRARLVLVGHLDTVIADERHLAARSDGNVLTGSGTIDMKGGDALALGVFRSLAARRAEFAEIALLLVNDEEFRTSPFAHGPRFAGFDACLCFEGGERAADGSEAVVVKRKAAAAIRVDADGVAAHSGANPDHGRSALLALAEVAQRLAALHDPAGPQALTVVPTMMSAGEAINAVPGAGQLFVDMRADREDAFDAVIAAVPNDIDGVGLAVERLRLWPGMDARELSAAPLARTAELIGRPVVAAARGGASDASNLAPHVPLAIDGLGPLGGHAHNPGEYLLIDSLAPRAELALALVDALLEQ